ncbi:MAG: methyltransferase domain-containing protein [Gammaproteobacteria bacterium]|nr:methyltransferase domain-containing protein [Gammaproteobacteria bacterium]MDH3468854.1 methyltransferase domain-containing protein [Gammaproteobacteria bacterium]
MPNVTPTFLDQHQYSYCELEKYEAIYGENFISPGGMDTALEFIGLLDPRSGERVLDIGCGFGGSALLMAREYGARVHGIDLSANMVATAVRRCYEAGAEGSVSLEQRDCLELTANAEFDAVYSRDVFLHIHDKPKLYNTIHRALIPNGRLLFTDYACSNRAKSAGFLEYVEQRGYHLLRIEQYVDGLTAAGFTDIIAEDRSAQLLRIHERELTTIETDPTVNSIAGDFAELWRTKIARIRSGEHRWPMIRAKIPA